MAIIEDPKLTITVGLIINLNFFALLLYSHVNLFFTDARDSFVDSFIIFIFLDYNINNKTLAYLNMVIMFFVNGQ